MRPGTHDRQPGARMFHAWYQPYPAFPGRVGRLNRGLSRPAHALLGSAQVAGRDIHPENPLALMADDMEGFGRADGPGNGLTVTAALACDDSPHCVSPLSQSNRIEANGAGQLCTG
jgi:hypothetical protein